MELSCRREFNFQDFEENQEKTKNRKSSCRACEKADLNETHGFLTDLEMSKSSSRVGEISIFKILQENESLRFPKVTHPLESIFCILWVPFLGPFWDQKSMKHVSLFQTSFLDACCIQC